MLALPVFLLVPVAYLLLRREIRPFAAAYAQLNDRIESQRFDRVETQLGVLQVRQEAMGDDVRGVADGVVGNYELLKGIETRADSLEGRLKLLEG